MLTSWLVVNRRRTYKIVDFIQTHEHAYKILSLLNNTGDRKQEYLS